MTSFEDVLDAVEAGLLVVDVGGIVRYANAAAHALLGRDELEGGHFGIPSGAGVRTTIEAPGADHRRLALTRTPTWWNDAPATVVALHDVTEPTKQIDALTAALDETRLALAGASHELRTPLSVILGTVELLLDRERAPEGAELEMYLGRLKAQATRMRVVVENFLTTARADAGHLRTAPLRFDLRAVVAAVADAAAIPGDGVRIDVEAELSVTADAAHVELILLNLLSNARKYGELPVDITANTVADRVVVRVRDRGPGVPEPFVDALFERYTREDTATAVKGTGLGLALARRLALLNGGQLRYESGHHGAVFVLELPADEASAESTRE